jgi:dihydroorotase
VTADGTALTRRTLLRRAGAAAAASAILHAQPESAYDVIVAGGHVVDPATKLSARADVAIRGGKLVRVGGTIDTASARQVIDARGCIVTPGLVDTHVHVYDGVAPLGIPPDANCIAKGVTTVLDGGSAGAHTFPGFRKYIINAASTRVYALLNISVTGQSTFSTANPHGELLDLHYVNASLAAQTIERNRDRLLGVKVRLTENIAGAHDVEVLRRACEAARAVRLPVMAHIGGSKSPLKAILALLQSGDVITHAFRAGAGGILDERGHVLPEVKDAIARGVFLDVGHGANGFSFATAERALQQDVLPFTISSDLHAYNYNGPVYDLVTTLSKFLMLGLSLEHVIERATVNPARAFPFPNSPGKLVEGRVADISVFRLSSRDVIFTDSEGQTRKGTRMLQPISTLREGVLYAGPAQ